jgi:hypothetical protein
MTDVVKSNGGEVAAPTMLETVMRAIAQPGMTPEVARQYLELGRELQKDQAQAAFNAAFAALKNDLPVIDKKGVVLNKAGKVQFKYARYDDLHEAITPLLARHGFATSFDFREPEKGRLTVVLDLLHTGGHSRQYQWTLPAMGDNAYVTNLQNAAAARSFGKRNILIDALDILTRDADSDGVPRKPPELITEQQAMEMEDVIHVCTERDPKFTGLFAKWLKAEYQVDGPRSLYQEQFRSVMDKLREKKAALGVA